MYKGVVFDLDGTLANSIEDIADSMNKVLQEKNLDTHDYITYKTFVGRGIKSLVENALPKSHRDASFIEESFQRMMKVYDDNCIAKTALYPGISDLLNSLRDRNLKIAIFSNKANELTQKVVNVLLANWQLEMVIGAGGDIPRKPDPKGALLISEKMGIAPEELMYVGDSGVDMETANNSGMHAVGVLWGFRDMEELLENGAQTIIHHPMDLIQSLD
ncbi:MAG: HAD family hydrolase [Labilibaculum sp.]|nr:HAD family hydrolase [Labilibaculum sp.]MBI9059838.1 HAD family hydrolase [Labilibaculum sp.]